ncbi:MAG: hypothetical protein ABW167_07580 [Baekduia sp.]
MPASALEPPLDVNGDEIEEGDKIAYPKGSGSDGSEIVVGVVDEVKDGQDRWRKPCRVLMVRPQVSSEGSITDQRRRIWMTRKTVILLKGGTWPKALPKVHDPAEIVQVVMTEQHARLFETEVLAKLLRAPCELAGPLQFSATDTTPSYIITTKD